MATNSFRTVYAEKIFRLAEEKTDEIYYNSSADHAIIVHQALMGNAADYVDIFSSSMCSEISNNQEYCRLVDTFLKSDKKHRINIILTDYEDGFTMMPIAKTLLQYPLQVSIKRYDGRALYKGKPAHFTVSDDRAFRLETDIEQHMAFGNFNSPRQATELKGLFDKIFNSPLSRTVTPC